MITCILINLIISCSGNIPSQTPQEAIKILLANSKPFITPVYPKPPESITLKYDPSKWPYRYYYPLGLQWRSMTVFNYPYYYYPYNYYPLVYFSY